MTRKVRKPLALAMMAALAAQPMALPVVAQAGQVASLEAQASALTPVRNAWHNSYRVYNSRLKRGQHHYTKSAAERDSLVKNNGWKDEGIAWYGLAK